VRYGIRHRRLERGEWGGVTTSGESVPRLAVAHRIVLALASFTFAAVGQAQSDETRGPLLDSRLTVGRQVRGIDATGNRVTGRILALAGDTLLIQVNDSLRQFSIAARSFGDVEVFTRGYGGARIGMGIGLVLGGAAYIGWCARNGYDCNHVDEDPDPYDDVQPTPLYSVMAISLASVGGMLGYVLTPFRWQSVTTPVRVGIMPGRRGVVLGLSLRR
jgi:hypothetical protein